jgi:dihydrofolate synthase / folylpolyglutamate synthase
MSYPDSVQYLYALGNELKPGAKMGLERMQALLTALGSPERNQRFVHVAGTNGKGSTCAMIASALSAAGEPTGLYTSPHLLSPVERIQINGVPVSEKMFASAFEEVHAVAERMVSEGSLDAHPSYFETVTAMALLIFARDAGIVVFEVGLGGRLDATNVVEPELCVITPVHYDHENFLGNTLPAIAAEKAGILKRGVPVIEGPQEDVAAFVIEERARALGCALIRVADLEPAEVAADPTGSAFTLDGQRYRCPLPGRHQIDNAVAAVLACRQLGLTPAVIADGMARAVWPGRLEFVRRAPDFVLDGAHNPSGARALAAYIREFCGQRPVWLVYGTMRDKAIEEVTPQLFPLASRLILTAPSFPRALRPEVLLEAAEQLAQRGHATTAANVAEAISQAEQAPPEAIVFFTGSLYLVGEARALLMPSRFVQ